ncbi:hypothetical protein [Maliponia aquimaris]|uniref:Uncharacterized protein n=1 Tax=Maliponia aquimaris TaxID=1673631 RepID=A0A238K611_9RHOB|nr:hypothetical protein [Maliponia aquimaris]SMX38265.1 hypothetical protein MAA8898_01457 [Maliponia aquimaris]
MPEVEDGSILAGVVVALLVRLIVRRRGGRLPGLGLLVVFVVGAYAGPPALDLVLRAWSGIPILKDLTGGAIFIGLWVALLVLTLFERKDQARRVPIWAGILAALVAAVTVPPFLDWATGMYQPASLRADVNGCTKGMLGQVQPRSVTNICDFPITVGLCLPNEVNPAPCVQSMTLAPGQSASFDPGEARLASLPANPGGLTVVACRTPDRPSRWTRTGGRGYEGVCLPPG